MKSRSQCLICMQRINDKTLLDVSGGFHDEATRAAAASIRPCQKISIHFVLPGIPWEL